MAQHVEDFIKICYSQRYDVQVMKNLWGLSVLILDLFRFKHVCSYYVRATKNKDFSPY